jgi:cell division protein ZapA
MSETKVRDKGAVTISVLGREFRLACPEGEEKQLLASVDYLNRKVKDVRDTNKVVGNERIAIMAALNIAHELVSKRADSTSADSPAEALEIALEIRGRIVAMQEAVESALAADQENLF